MSTRRVIALRTPRAQVQPPRNVCSPVRTRPSLRVPRHSQTLWPRSISLPIPTGANTELPREIWLTNVLQEVKRLKPPNNRLLSGPTGAGAQGVPERRECRAGSALSPEPCGERPAAGKGRCRTYHGDANGLRNKRFDSAARNFGARSLTGNPRLRPRSRHPATHASKSQDCPPGFLLLFPALSNIKTERNNYKKQN